MVFVIFNSTRECSTLGIDRVPQEHRSCGGGQAVRLPVSCTAINKGTSKIIARTLRVARISYRSREQRSQLSFAPFILVELDLACSCRNRTNPLAKRKNECRGNNGLTGIIYIRLICRSWSFDGSDAAGTGGGRTLLPLATETNLQHSTCCSGSGLKRSAGCQGCQPCSSCREVPAQTEADNSPPPVHPPTYFFTIYSNV